MTTTDFAHLFGGARVMAILRGLPVAETVRLAERAWDLGIEVVEVPVATADAVPALRAGSAGVSPRATTSANPCSPRACSSSTWASRQN
ncbi:hypothetical protein AB0J36_33495, partial [Micromonospora sp. NPDC049662]